MRLSLRSFSRKIVPTAVVAGGIAMLQLVAVAPATAQQQLLSSSAASELGLTQAWQRQLVVPSGAQSIVDQKLFVDRKNTQRFVEVVRGQAAAAEDSQTGGDEAQQNRAAADRNKPGAENQPAAEQDAAEVLVRMRVGQLDARGNPIDQDEAERLARNEIRKFERRGIAASISTRETPTIRLYTLADDGTLGCRDAETGRSVWITRVGDRRLGYIGFGMDETYLSVLNGSNLVILDAASGDILHQRPTKGAPQLGCVHVGNYCLVPTIGGAIEGYAFDDPYENYFYQSVAGAALTLPVKSPDSLQCAWTTEAGYVYVMEVEGDPDVLFRYDTKSIVSGQIAAAEGKRYFMASEAGQVYALRGSHTGEVLWSRPFGVPFYDEPTVIKNQILVRSTYGNLYSLDASARDQALGGGGTWDEPTPGIDTVLAATGNRVYATTLSGHLTVLDLESGKRTANFRQIRPNRVLINRWSDRLYLINDRGTIQCLRPADRPLPTLQKTTEEIEAQGKPEDQPKEKAQQQKPAEKPQEDEPFDPFATPPGEQDDPFATPEDDDPFGGAGDDPFAPAGGNDDNPF